MFLVLTIRSCWHVSVLACQCVGMSVACMIVSWALENIRRNVKAFGLALSLPI